MPAIASPRIQKRPRLEIIPFIDIMFFLLATFMMVSINMIANKGIDLNLPAAQSSHPQEPIKETVTISITKEGLIHLDRQPVTSEELISRLRAYQQAHPDGRMVLQADEQAPFGTVMAVMDQARTHGLGKFFIRTRAADAKPPTP